MEKKRFPIGIIIICIILIFQVASIIINSLINTALLNLPDETKTQFLQTSEFKVALNITTIEQFDKFCKMNAASILRPINLSILMVNLILLVGLLRLKKWARIGMAVFSCYPIMFAIWSFWNRLLINPAQHVAKVISIILYCAIIYYLTRPKIKEQFK